MPCDRPSLFGFKERLYDTAQKFRQLEYSYFHNTPFRTQHLNRHKYPMKISMSVSTTATAAIGRNTPAAMPMQNDSADRPIAFVHPLMQKFTMSITTSLNTMQRRMRL